MIDTLTTTSTSTGTRDRYQPSERTIVALNVLLSKIAALEERLVKEKLDHLSDGHAVQVMVTLGEVRLARRLTR